MNNLGILYFHGCGVKQDYNKAKEYYERAAELGDSDSMFNLGFLYENDLGVKQNYHIAKAYYERSIKLGNQNAANKLRALYDNGHLPIVKSSHTKSYK